MIVDESFKMQNQNRWESLDEYLLGSGDNTFTRSVFGYGLGLVELTQGIGNGSDIWRLDVKLNRLIWFKGD